MGSAPLLILARLNMKQDGGSQVRARHVKARAGK